MIRTGLRQRLAMSLWLLLPVMLIGQGDPMALETHVGPAPIFPNQKTQIRVELPQGTDPQGLYGLSLTLHLDSEWGELSEESVGFGTTWFGNAITIVKKTSPTTIDIGISNVDRNPVPGPGVLLTLDITPTAMGRFGVSWSNVKAQNLDGEPINVSIAPLQVDVLDPNRRIVEFNVDMRTQIQSGAFNPALNDTVFLVGSFDEWAQGVNELTQAVGSLYSARVTVVGAVDDVIQFKYRIVTGDGRELPDAGWEQAVGPGENGNRTLSLGPIDVDQVLAPVYFDNRIPVVELALPIQDQVDVDLNPQFKWSKIDHVDSYVITLSEDPALLDPLLMETVTDTVFTSTVALDHSERYYWSVRAVAQGGLSDWAPARSFTTLPNPDVRQVTFRVDMSVQQATGFFKPELNDVVEVLGQFNNFEAGTNDMMLIQGQVYEASFPVIGAKDDALLYKFRVRPGDGRDLLEGGWELTVGPGGDGQRQLVLGEVDVNQVLPIRFFNNHLPVPVLTSPANAAPNLALTPLLEWAPIPNIDQYTVMLATESTFSTPLINVTVSGTSFSPSVPLNPATVYFWTVRSELDGISSNWAPNMIFSTEDNPENPVAHLLFDGVVEDVSGSGLTLSLNSPLYTTDRFGNSGLAWLLQSNQDLKIIHNDKLPSTHLTISFWFNRSGNPTDEFENYLYKDGAFQTYMSDEQRLFTGFPTGTPGEWSFYGTPTLNLNLNRWYQYTFTFDRTSGTMSHYIDGELVWQDVETSSDRYLKTSQANLSIGRSGVLNDHHARGGLDELRLYDRSLSAAEVKALYTLESGSRTIPVLSPELISPANNATGVPQEPVFRWAKVTEAVSYGFQLSTDSGFGTLIRNVTLTDTLYSMTDELEQNTTHYWRVKAVGATTESDWSPTRQFTTVSDVFRPFITTWKTDNQGLSGSNQIVIPGLGSGYQIQWQEVGNVGNSGSTVANATHILSFPTPGTYRVSISGSLLSFGWVPSANEDDANKLLSIDQWGDIEWNHLDWLISGAVTARILATDTPNLSEASSIRGAFQSASAMNDPVTDWDVGSIVDMRQLFEDASQFNQPLFTWDMSNAELLDGMFHNAVSFNQSIGNWDVSKVTSMSEMFSGASAFNRVIGNWNVSSVVTMEGMFRNATKFNQYLGNWDIRNVTNMLGMFDNAGMSTQNYDNTLIAWANKSTTPRDITIGVAGLVYDFPGEAARTKLINDFGWTFVGDSPFTIRPPVLLEPADGTQDSPLQTTIRWSSVEGATGYDVQVSTSNQFSELSLDVSVANDATTVVFNGQPYTVYFVRVRSKLNTIIGSWSDVVMFETVLTPPTIVFPSPEQTDISTAPVLTWQSSSPRTQSEVAVSSDPTFTDLILAQTVSASNVTLTNLSSGATYHWRVRSIDASNSKSTSYAVGSFTTRPFIPTVPVAATITFPQSRTVTGYRMFGVPGVDEFPVKSVLSGIPQIQYRLFHDNGGDVDYLEEFTSADNWVFSTGRGYWILSTNAIEISSSITNVTPDNADLFPIQLHTGWNIITNPLTVPVKWADVQSINAIDWDLFEFDGSYSVADTLRSFSGYYLNNTSGSARQILIPFTPGSLRKSADEPRSKDDTPSTPFAELRIGFHTEEGIKSGSVNVSSGRVASTKPHPSLHFSAYGVVMMEAKESGSRRVFHREVTEGPMDEMVRQVRIQNQAMVPMELSCVQTTAAMCALLNPTSGRIIELEAESDVAMVLPTGDYLWMVGSPQFVHSELESRIPDQFHLSSIYPNPFNPTTSIRFSIPQSGWTHIEVYDVLGRRVSSLVNEVLPRGWHQTEFEASGLSTGVYVVVVRSGGHTMTQKVTLLK